MGSLVKQQDQAWPEREPQLATEAFHVLRRKLIHFFEARRMSDAEDLADEVLMRIARKLAEGLEVSDITRYSFGVAKNVHREKLRERPHLVPFSGLSDKEMDEVVSARDERLAPGPRLEEEEESRTRESCLQEALLELDADDRELLLAYYGDGLKDRKEVIAARKELAARLGIRPMTLRVKVHRLLMSLEAAVLRKISRKSWERWS